MGELGFKPSSSGPSTVLISHCCCNKLPQLNGLKQDKFTVLQFWRLEVQNQSCWANVKVLALLHSFWRLREKTHFLFLSEVPFLHLQNQQPWAECSSHHHLSGSHSLFHLSGPLWFYWVQLTIQAPPPPQDQLISNPNSTWNLMCPRLATYSQVQWIWVQTPLRAVLPTTTIPPERQVPVCYILPSQREASVTQNRTPGVVNQNKVPAQKRSIITVIL